MASNQSKAIVGGVIAAGIALFTWRIYSNWPTVIKGTGPVAELQLRSQSVTVTLTGGVTVSEVANMRVFERCSFDTVVHEAEEILGQPADKWAEEDGASFHEYIRPMGRLRFYEAPEYDDDGQMSGIANWVVAIPNQLLADQFFDKAIALHLDLSKKTQAVVILVPAQHCSISAVLDGPRVSRIAWAPHY